MEVVRIDIVGLGNMGSVHARTVLAGKVPRLEPAAGCDSRAGRGVGLPAVRRFDPAETLIASGVVDAVHEADAMLMSTWLRRTVELPWDRADYERLLHQRIERSTFKRQSVRTPASADDLAQSFGRCRRRPASAPR